MLLESKPRRDQLMKLLNGAGAEVEKMVNNFTSKGGVAKNDATATAEEPTEFR